MATNKKLDVISIGSATEDVFVYMPKGSMAGEKCVLTPGSKVEIDELDYFTGGGAVNTSVAFAHLGLKAGILCAVGEDESASEILNVLKKEKVDVKNILKMKGAHTAYSVILTGMGKDRIILHYGGTTAMLSHAKINTEKLSAKWFYLSSMHSDSELLSKVARHAKKIGAKIAFNPGQKELALGLDGLKKIFASVDVLLLNSEEALKLTGSADVHRNLRKLCEFADFVAITQGKHGAHATDGKSTYFMRPYDVPVVDVTGAGDSFGAGFVAAIMKGRGAEEGIKWGTANASSEVMHLGTKNTLLSENGIKKFAHKYGSKDNRVEREEF
ncbi:MAG TPA: carbohydrate kinase family protein [archaeon]|nr:carbohydrate kinase family protein [archaeon]